jgi:hypothetical protein
MKTNQTKKRVSPINTSSDRFMVENGLRNKRFSLDRSVFVKTDLEKQKLKELRKKIKS